VSDTPHKLPKGEKGTWNINQDVQGKGDLKVATKLPGEQLPWGRNDFT